MTKKRKISLAVVSCLLSALFFLSVFMIWKEVSDRKADKEHFQTLVEMVEPEPTEETESEPTAEEEEQASEAAEARNLAPLFAENSDCIGWIYIPGTEVNYPVMHTPDNPQKYLRKNFYGEYSQSGVPFLDGGCSLQSDNLILFGHNMRNGTMFSAVTGYAVADYQKEHPAIEFETAAGCTVYTVFAAVSVKKTDAWYDFIDCSDKESFEKALSDISARARYTTEAVPQYGDRLLTLSTCYGSSKDDRLIVIAVSS